MADAVVDPRAAVRRELERPVAPAQVIEVADRVCRQHAADGAAIGRQVEPAHAVGVQEQAVAVAVERQQGARARDALQLRAVGEVERHGAADHDVRLVGPQAQREDRGAGDEQRDQRDHRNARGARQARDDLRQGRSVLGLDDAHARILTRDVPGPADGRGTKPTVPGRSVGL